MVDHIASRKKLDHMLVWALLLLAAASAAPLPAAAPARLNSSSHSPQSSSHSSSAALPGYRALKEEETATKEVVDEEEDLSRLARHVAGHAVGVVLTGGGGHGLAHLGALRALEDAGVPVDVVGGTSQGALVGVEPASGNVTQLCAGQGGLTSFSSHVVIPEDGAVLVQTAGLAKFALS